MIKILYVDDDFKPIYEHREFDIKYVMTSDEAYKAFADDFVYDVVSLDGRFPYVVPLADLAAFNVFATSYRDIFKRIYRREWYSGDSIEGGIYLLYLMKKFNYVPKIVILHSFDTVLRNVMMHIIKDMFYNQPIYIMQLDKLYPMYYSYVQEIERFLKMQKAYEAISPEPEDVYIKLQKGKNYFIITPESVIFHKKGIIQSKKSAKGYSALIDKKITEGYSVVHGEWFILHGRFVVLPQHI